MVTIERQREIARKAREFTTAVRDQVEDLAMNFTGEIANDMSADENQSNEDWDTCFNQFLRIVIVEATELFRPVVKERKFGT